MKVKKCISIVLISILIYSLSGCSNKNVKLSKDVENNKKIEVTINSDIKEYSPSMSSTPGIPLTVKLNSNTSADKIQFHWITEQGTFLNWQQDKGNINVLGKDIKTNEQKIYWSIDPNVKTKDLSFKIFLKIEDNDNSKVMYETSIQVDQNQEGLFSIKK